MRKILHIILCLSLLYLSGVVYAATCTLNTQPSPAVASYEENIDKIITTMREESAGLSCSDGVENAENTKKVLNIMQKEYNIGKIFFRNNPFYLDTSDKMLLPSANNHKEKIEDIQLKILETGREIGGKCADKERFKEDVQIGNSRYKTKNRSFQEVLNDMHSQTSEVLSFYQDLASNVRNNEYLDESNFTVAPEGFSDDMREFYSAANIQQCHDEDAKKQKIQETQKNGLAEAVKIPRMVKLWEQVRELFLFGKSAQPDSPEEENPTLTAHAKPGGLGNSVALQNDLSKYMFGFPGNILPGANKKTSEARKQNAPDKGLVRSKLSQVNEDLVGAGVSVTSSDLSREESVNAQRLAGVVEALSSGEENQIGSQIGEQVYMIPTEGVLAIEEGDKTQENLEKMKKEVCDILDYKQALNVKRPSCEEIFGDRDPQEFSQNDEDLPGPLPGDEIPGIPAQGGQPSNALFPGPVSTSPSNTTSAKDNEGYYGPQY